MTALELISAANQVLFVGLFVAVLRAALKRPSRASWDTVLLFGPIAAVIILARFAPLAGVATDDPVFVGVVLLALNVAPYAMIRLVDDFSAPPGWVVRAGTVAFVGVALLGFAALSLPQLFELVTILWFLVVGGYSAYAFGTAAARSTGITRRRMTAVATGAILFSGAIVIVFANALAPGRELGLFTQLGALVAGIAFFMGFAPPPWIRRAWREPDLRRFLERSIHLVGLTDERRVVMELQQAAADAFGATGAAIGLVADDRPALRYVDRSGEWAEYPDDQFIGGRAFREQRRIVAMDAGASDPDHASIYVKNAANTVIAAPVTTEDRRIGVLTVYALRPPVFVEDDLWLLELLADQTAVVLEARLLAADANNLRAREDAARLKEEFLSAAAHDLRTPLTVVLGQAELLERRLARDPRAPVDSAGVARMAREARRLRDLVSELLDAKRLEQGGALIDPSPVDLRRLADTVRQRYHDQGLDLKVVVPGAPLVCAVDTARIEQVIENLVGNALKYTSSGEMPELHMEAGEAEARISVVDHGIGIPEGERERVFERFYRASNVQSITDTGIGLGLYICRRLIEAHGGRIWVEPTPAGGSTFTVSLPMEPAPVEAETTPASIPRPITEAAADA